MNNSLMKRLKTAVPIYAILPLLFVAAFNSAVYYGGDKIASSWKHYDFTIEFDRYVPLIPEFTAVYLGCFLFWIINYIIIARQGKEHCMRFVFADVSSRVICFLFFLLLPTTNVRPELVGDGIWIQILRGIYQTDSATNLFPSIHCLVSWFCFIGIRGKKNIPKQYRVFSCIFAILVFISTQVTKQHYIVDVFGGVILAELTLYVSFHTNWYRGLAIIFEKLTGIIFGRQIYATNILEENNADKP